MYDNQTSLLHKLRRLPAAGKPILWSVWGSSGACKGIAAYYDHAPGPAANGAGEAGEPAGTPTTPTIWHGE